MPHKTLRTDFYTHHLFVCENKRDKDDKRRSCGHMGASKLRDYAKDRIKKLKLNGKGKVRVNSAGCLDRCELGPVLVIYPDNVWYHAESKSDIDEIIQSHLIEGNPVKRLALTRNQCSLTAISESSEPA